MSEQRIDTGADAATSRAADPSEGLGTSHAGTRADPLDPSTERTAGGDTDMAQPRVDQPGAGDADTADTEGAAGLQEAYGRAEQARSGTPDLGGREPSAPAGGGSAGSGSGGSGAGSPPAETGEVSAEPNPDRRAEDPGTVATEFGDRADTAPDDEIAHPSI